MKGLLCKDWAILVNSYKKNFLIMVVLYLGMAVCLHMDYLCYALVAVCGVYASSTMNFDDFAHWDTYARTLPVTPGQVVGCKYLLGLLFTLFGSVCAAVGIFLTGQYTDVLEAAFSILLIAAFSLLLFAVNMLAVGIHPYFLPMTYAVTLALLLEYAVKQRQWLRPALLWGGNMLCTAALGWALGLLYGTATSGGQALYGYFAMNLNALWNPAGVNGVLYSRLLPAQNQVGGNYDAFAYLGLGVLAALPVVVVSARRHILGAVRRHWALCAVCAVLTAFAVSNVITANGVTLATLPLPASFIKLFSVFRSGGRLFWPVYYLLTLAAFAGLARLPRGAVWVALFAAVQLWDVSPALCQRHDAMQAAQVTDAFPSELDSDFWQSAAQYRHIESVQGMQADSLHLALWAADNGMTTNDPFAARYDETALAAERQTALDALDAGTPQSDTLYLFEDEGAFLQAVEPVKALAWCGRVTSADGSASWYVIAPGLQGQTFDALCTLYDEDYPLRLAEYTDALWNRGVLDETKQTVCFKDSPFARAKLDGSSLLCAGGQEYPILKVDDHDAGWLMVTLDIEDATVLWDQELTTK